MTLDTINAIINDEIRWALLGLYHGYPACCVEHWVELRSRRPLELIAYVRELRQHVPETEYIPCAACRERFIRERTGVERAVDSVANAADQGTKGRDAGEIRGVEVS